MPIEKATRFFYMPAVLLAKLVNTTVVKRLN